jgi:N-acetylmuramoyl-L-alanine amidase
MQNLNNRNQTGRSHPEKPGRNSWSLSVNKVVPAWHYQRYIASFLVTLGLCLTFFNSSAQKETGYTLRTVVIDAGHGGKDPGAICKKGKEKDITLAVALKVGTYITKNFDNVKVIYTRSKDEFLELHKRAGVANSNNADLFISIHVNASKKSDPYGSETYVMGLNKTASNLEVAKAENNVILKEEDYSKQYDGFDPNSPEGSIIFTLYQNAFLDQSLNFASKVQDQFRERTGRFDRGVKQDGFLVLWKTTMPSVLIEIGFISHPEEADYLLTDEGQTFIASAIFRSFRDYKNEVEGKGYVKPLPRTNQNLENSQSADKDSLGSDSVKVNSNKHPGDTNNRTVNQNGNHSTVVKADSSKKAPILYSSIIFKVQFASSDKPVKLLPENFKGIREVEELKDGTTYKYMVGNCTSYEEILSLQAEVRKKYPDAFVIAYKNGSKIPVKEALKEIKKP